MSMQCPAGTFAYVIRSGDNFYSLAQRYNTTVDAIIAANPGVNPNALQIGQTVCIPGMQPPPATCPSGSTTYVIRSGDTLFALAQRFNTTVNAILAINPGIDPNALRVGQRICIPGVQPPPPTTCPAGTTAYIIRSGDTLFALAQRFNTSVNAILAANPGIDPNALRIGQRICIPGVQPPPPTTCPTGTTSYVVRSGDTLYGIAQRFNVSLNALIEANPGIDPNRLQIGMVICIPGTRGESVTDWEDYTSQ
ncbi:MAG TPA: LysM peptidoglycan-binding domain-containing protein [Bacillota bacterium]